MRAGCAIWALMGVVTWRAAVVGGDLPPHLASLLPKGRAIDTHSYYSYNKFDHKACRAGGLDGVCMFVWECIKTEGKHVGMCMDGFMFGSCCTHDEVNELSPAAAGGAGGESEEIVPGIITKNSSLLLPEWPSTTAEPTPTPPPQPSLSTGQPSLITSRPITIQRPPRPPLTTTTPAKERPTSLSPPLLTSSVWSHLPPLTVTSPHPVTTPYPITSSRPVTPLYPVTPPKPPTRPTRPPKPTKPTRATVAPWWTTPSTTNQLVPIHKTTPPPTPSTTTTTTTSTTTPATTTTTPTTTTTTARPTTTSTTTTTTSTTTTTTTTTTTPRPAEGPIVSSAHTKHQCGVTNMRPQPEGRIVNGTNSKFGEWPWQVSVRRTSFFGFSSTHRCGGALLNEQWAATAGHCVDDLLTSQIRIRVGEYDFSSVLEPHPYVERAVKKKAVHPKYNFFTYEYDLALVQTEKPFTFMPHISPICLPGNNDLLIGEMATVTGWGRLSEHGRLPSVLQKASVPIVSNDKCKDMFLKGGRQEHIPDIFLCAGYEKGGIDSCQGDSGGPLQARGADGRYFLAGIISWGIGCGEPNLPGVCTRISKFVPWILENVT